MATKVSALNNVTNDAKDDIEISSPFMIEAVIEGTAALLFHRNVRLARVLSGMAV